MSTADSQLQRQKWWDAGDTPVVRVDGQVGRMEEKLKTAPPRVIRMGRPSEMFVGEQKTPSKYSYLRLFKRIIHQLMK
jgi:hypothetical protein